MVLFVLKGHALIQHKSLQFGGAAAMFVTIFVLLNKYVPEMREGIISGAQAAQSQTLKTKSGSQPQDIEVFLRPDTQIITDRDLKDLDLNKYVVDGELGIAFIRDNRKGWVTEKVEKYDSFEIADIPLVKIGANQLTSMGLPEPKPVGILAIKQEKSHNIILEKNTSIGGIKIGENPFDDPAYFRRIAKFQLETGLEMAGESISEEEEAKFLDSLEEKSADTREKYNKYINRRLPIKKTINSGLYVSIYRTTDFHSSSKLIEDLYASLSPLDRAVTILLSIHGVGSAKNLKVDQSSGVASYDGGVRIRGVSINDTLTDITINDVGFVYANEEKIVLVKLISLDVDGPETAYFLKAVMDSVYFTKG